MQTLSARISRLLRSSLRVLLTPGQTQVAFVDVTESSGIRFEHVSDPDKRYIVESMSGGVAAFDFDRDGHLDLYFVNSETVARPDQRDAPSHLYRNLGGWKFEEIASRMGVAYHGWGMGVLRVTTTPTDKSIST